MKFDWAIRQLDVGKKVRRKYWENPNSYICLLDKKLIICHTGRQAYFMIGHFEADDWELYEEESLSDKRREIRCLDGGIGWGYPEPDVKEFIKRLKEKLKTDYPNTLFNKELDEVLLKLAGEKLI